MGEAARGGGAGAGAGAGALGPPWMSYAALAAGLTLLLLFYSQSLALSDGAHVLRLVALPPDASDGLERDDAPPPAGDAERAGFVVKSPRCRIPDIDAYDPSIRKFLKAVPPIVCSSSPPLTFVAPDAEDEAQSSNETDASTEPTGHVLRIDTAVLGHYQPKDKSKRSGHLACCYSNVTRFTTPVGHTYTSQADNMYNVSSCTNFTKEIKLRPEEEFILVRCSINNKEVYVNMHGIVPIKKSVIERRKERKSPDDDAWLNILLVGFDSISRLNLQRTMPRTVAYLKRAGFVELKGYNKIGDNTFPNIMAILTGLSLELLGKTCYSPKKKVDNCPFIWKEYKNHSYVTVYAEDEPTLSTFNYHKVGFLNQPTDYYFRPFMLAGTHHLKLQTRHSLDVCMGPTLTTSHIMQYALDFVTAFRNYLYFGLFWLNNFSHNDINDPGAMDLRTLQFFNELSGTGTYNNTLVIFFSDHGMRFGKIRETFVGWLEERLPYIYIHVPDWFKDKYPVAYKNLITNRHRLTSPYDLHVTLKDVLEIAKNNNFSHGNVSLACPKCKSMFLEDYGDRSCDDAGITPHWCTCTQFKDIQVNNSVAQEAAKHALSEIQNKVKGSLVSNDCAELVMGKVIKAKQKVHMQDKSQNYDDYLVIFETLPGNGLFEVTVRHILKPKQSFSVLGTISRINSYAKDSFCVQDAELKLYCFCRPP